MTFVKIGSITKTVGLKGEVRVYSTSDFRYDRFAIGNKVNLVHPTTSDSVKMTVSSHRVDGRFDIVGFKNFQDINLIEKYLGYDILVEKNPEELPEGYYFHDDLLGSEVLDESNEQVIGTVSAVEEYSAYKTLRIKRENNKDVLVPFVPAFIVNVDIQSKKIWIHVLEGLL